MRYVLGLADLTMHDPNRDHDHTALCLIVAAVTPSRQTVECDPHDMSGGVGVVLECPEEQAEAIIRCVAVRCVATRKHVMRIYQQRSGGTAWCRLTHREIARLAGKVEGTHGS